MSARTEISGFLKSPKKASNGRVYRGRFTCPNVQWTGTLGDTLATFTVTADELADAAHNGLLWTDQDVQRGIQPEASPPPPRELSLGDGYPDTAKYIFDSANADDIVEKLLSGEKLFLSPLVWNLRPGHFKAYWDSKAMDLYLYEGRVYLPDSHHRHQAIIKAVQLWRASPKEYPKFSGDREFKIDLYFLNREDEGNYFFDKNQRPRPVAKSKAFDLTTLDDLSILAKKVIDLSQNLRGNVNRVTDRLTAHNAQIITLSTLREMMRGLAQSDQLDSSEVEGLASVAAEFYDLLAQVRPELGVLSTTERRKARENSIVDAAVMMHGYAALMRDYNDDLAKLGTARARKFWEGKLGAALGPHRRYRFGRWSGDFFERNNPLWQAIGIAKPSRDGRRLTILNTGAARAAAGRALRQLLARQPTPTNIEFLSKT